MGPADLLKAWTLSIYELMEVVVVNEDEDLIFVAFQVVAPTLKGFNDSQELLIVSLILSFDKYYLSKKKATECY